MLFSILNFMAIILSLEASMLIQDERSQYVRTLNDGNNIPAIALGTFTKMSDMVDIQEAIIWAVQAGYRHFNTAVFVDDDVQMGEAIYNVTSSGMVMRNELFITITLDSNVNTSEGVVPALERDLAKLQLDYVDLFLIEFSLNLADMHEDYDVLDLWTGMVQARELGLAKSIGVSNFDSAQINKILTYSDVRPAVNQIEVSPTFTELELVAYCQAEDIAVMAYAPFGLLVSRPFRHNIISPTQDDERLMDMTSKYGKTKAQIVLRYLVDRGLIPIPESISKEHIEENIQIYDFELSPKDIYLINELNTNAKVYPLDGTDKAELNNYVNGGEGNVDSQY